MMSPIPLTLHSIPYYINDAERCMDNARNISPTTALRVNVVKTILKNNSMIMENVSSDDNVGIGTNSGVICSMFIILLICFFKNFA